MGSGRAVHIRDLLLRQCLLIVFPEAPRRPISLRPRRRTADTFWRILADHTDEYDIVHLGDAYVDFDTWNEREKCGAG